jgi:hypothetical protein
MMLSNWMHINHLIHIADILRWIHMHTARVLKFPEPTHVSPWCRDQGRTPTTTIVESKSPDYGFNQNSLDWRLMFGEIVCDGDYEI